MMRKGGGIGAVVEENDGGMMGEGKENGTWRCFSKA